MSFLKKICLALLISTFIVGKPNAKEESLLFKGSLPSGDIYYTSVMACGEIDGTGGEEIVITDDYGCFEILDWEPKSKSFRQKWLSDPIFETNKARRIFIPNTRAGYDTYIIFLDSSNNLIIYKWFDYITIKEPTIYLSRNPEFLRFSDFTIGEFASGYHEWEMALIASKAVYLTSSPINLGYLKIGTFKPRFTAITSKVIFNFDGKPKLYVDHGFGGSQGLLIVPKSIIEGKLCRVLYTLPPFNECKEYYFACKKGEKIGWVGKIQNNSPEYMSTYTRNERGSSSIKFFRLGDQLEYTFSVPVPSNVSSWELCDLDADSLRELVVLDFLGTLYVYDLHPFLTVKGK